ncbi:cysteine proteinase [Basidiobolus meristosporus CBS 931.73]|uniref:Cysteine proteinase n=1 Tax=Basidiobolus meristosporus CBS 931.73 TaxID=1314790 RepID=A0A1Y1YNF6_9FUNG|nr:cysteine proteinase [Basidiobolus meristosporus CBS 931.73]|eukprot:ORX99114.1 cysteine proteinase [Basidiobolus meristosporus CBS 931.73]
MTIHREDILRLRDNRWLNDELVNFYGALIMERANNQPEKYPAIHFFNTFFYPLLAEYGYTKVERWTRKIDLFAKELVFVPIHLGAHWCCAVIDIKQKRIDYYDPLLSNNPQCHQILQEYLGNEAKAKKGIELDLSEWTLNTPKQENSYDCGVFSCQYAEYRSRKSPLTFSQRHMHQFREQMIYEIVSVNLIN